jgi:hypothetical protein
VHNAFDAGSIHYLAKWEGLGPENLDCFGPHKALSYWLDAISQNPKISRFPAVLRIRIQIHRIHMFLGLLDPNPLVKGMEWIRILPSSCKNSKKNLDSYYFVTLFDFLSLKNDVNKTSKVISRNFCLNYFSLAS